MKYIYDKTIVSVFWEQFDQIEIGTRLFAKDIKYQRFGGAISYIQSKNIIGISSSMWYDEKMISDKFSLDISYSFISKDNNINNGESDNITTSSKIILSGLSTLATGVFSYVQYEKSKELETIGKIKNAKFMKNSYKSTALTSLILGIGTVAIVFD